MKLAECLLQEKPIRRALHTDRGVWFDPKIENHFNKLCLVTSDLRNIHNLSHSDFASDDWEIKPEPMKVEFECEWSVSGSGLYYPNGLERDILIKMHDSGKRFKVTCEEIVE